MNPRSNNDDLRPPSSNINFQSDSTPIPWLVYYFAFFTFSILTSLVSINLPVFLRQGYNLDWTTSTLLFIIPVVPALARPLLVRNIDRKPSLIRSLINYGIFFIVAGSTGLILCFWVGLGELVGLVGSIIALTFATFGGNLINVAVDSHVLRATPLELSARVNVNRKIGTFLGVLASQVFYISLVNIKFDDFFSWNMYFLASLASVIGFYLLCLGIMGSKPLLSTESVTLEYKILKKWIKTDKTPSKIPWAQIILLMVITFCFALPDGLTEVTFENYIIDTYAENGWMIYSSFLIFSGAIMVIGYVIARRLKKTVPEKWLLLVVPFNLAYYAILYFVPSVLLVIVLTIILFIFNGFMQVILFQFWQKNAFWWRPALLFQLFFFGYLVGKYPGILLSGNIMLQAGYPGIFLLSTILWGTALICNIFFIFWSKVKKSKENSGI